MSRIPQVNPVARSTSAPRLVHRHLARTGTSACLARISMEMMALGAIRNRIPMIHLILHDINIIATQPGYKIQEVPADRLCSMICHRYPTRFKEAQKRRLDSLTGANGSTRGGRIWSWTPVVVVLCAFAMSGVVQFTDVRLHRPSNHLATTPPCDNDTCDDTVRACPDSPYSPDSPDSPYSLDNCMLMSDPIESLTLEDDIIDIHNIDLDDSHIHNSDRLDRLDPDSTDSPDSPDMQTAEDDLVEQDDVCYGIDSLVPDNAFVYMAPNHLAETIDDDDSGRGQRGRWGHDVVDEWARFVLVMCVCTTGAVFLLRRRPHTAHSAEATSALGICEMAMSDMVHAVADCAHEWEGGMSVNAHVLTDAMYAVSCALYQGSEGSGPEVDVVLDNLRHALSTALSARTKIYRNDTLSAQHTLDAFMGHRVRRHSM